MERIWRDYGLSIVLFGLFVLFLTVQGITCWIEFNEEQVTHGQPVEVAMYINRFTNRVMENLQSEVFQLGMFVVLSTYLVHRGSPQSKDSDDKMTAQLDRIERKLSGWEGDGK